jgi:hypothetical protein
MNDTNQEIVNKIRQIQVTESIQSECFALLEEKVARYLSIQRLPLVPYTHFAPISAECQLLYRDGYFFACISLCQSVAEALSRFLCEKGKIRSRGDHEARVKRLLNESIITEQLRPAFEKIHERRNDYHHLNPGIPSDKETLRDSAYTVLVELAKIENEIFSFSVKDGVIIPKFPKYWK